MFWDAFEQLLEFDLVIWDDTTASSRTPFVRRDSSPPQHLEELGLWPPHFMLPGNSYVFIGTHSEDEVIRSVTTVTRKLLGNTCVNLFVKDGTKSGPKLKPGPKTCNEMT